MSNWVSKLKCECVCEEDDSMNIIFEWDENDPDLEYWNSLGDEGQKEFIINALYSALECYVD